MYSIHAQSRAAVIAGGNALSTAIEPKLSGGDVTDRD